MAEPNLEEARILDAHAREGDDAFDRAVRPRTLDEYVGQPRVTQAEVSSLCIGGLQSVGACPIDLPMCRRLPTGRQDGQIVPRLRINNQDADVFCDFFEHGIPFVFMWNDVAICRASAD